MKKYTVENDEGKRVTFEWDDDANPPTDTDMEEVFAASKQQPTSAPVEPAHEPSLMSKFSEHFGQHRAEMATDPLGGAYRAGGAIAKAGVETLGKVFEPVTKPLVENVVKPVAKAAYGTLTPEGKQALGATAQLLGKGIEKYKEVVPKGIQEDVSATGEYASVLPVEKLLAGLGKVAVNAKTATGKGLESVDKLAGKYAQETSGVSEKALRMAGTEKGRTALKSAYGTQAEVGQKLVDAIDNAWDVIPKSSEIKTALKSVPSINPTNIIDRLSNAIPKSAVTGESKAVVDKLNTKFDELASMVDGTGNIPAENLFGFRQELDNIIGDAYGKESTKYVTALKDVRNSIKEELVNAAKGTEYEPLMKEMATKLDALDKIKQIVGKSSDARELRAESFIRNINSLGKEKKKEWLDNFSNVFGGDFSKEAELAQLAEQMGESGKGTLLPRWTTGRSTLAKGTGLAFGSPRIASQVTLPATQKISDLGKALQSSKQHLTGSDYLLGGAGAGILAAQNENTSLEQLLNNMTEEEKQRFLNRK